jgi:hypothetical protein
MGSLYQLMARQFISGTLISNNLPIRSPVIMMHIKKDDQMTRKPLEERDKNSISQPAELRKKRGIYQCRRRPDWKRMRKKIKEQKHIRLFINTNRGFSQCALFVIAKSHSLSVQNAFAQKRPKNVHLP